jgi:DNA-binding XRE family transcriptional regulator
MQAHTLFGVLAHGKENTFYLAKAEVCDGKITKIVYSVSWQASPHPLPREHRGGPRLTSQTAREIRQRYTQEDILQRELAHQYGVGRETISEIIRNHRWHDPHYTPPTR